MAPNARLAAQNTHMLQRSNSIAASVTPWYTNVAAFAGCWPLPAYDATELDVSSGEDCIAGLPFNAFQQVLRVLVNAGSGGFDSLDEI